MNSAIVGLQWGDEGKGKVVQKFSRSHEWIVRFSGGPNAGHTVYHNGKKVVHHLVPTGTDKNKLFIGRGTLVNFDILNDEIAKLSEIYPDIKERLFISEWCRVITPVERWQDAEIEKLKGAKSVGTTGMGIGPTISNDANRIALHVFDLFDERIFREKAKLLKKFCGYQKDFEDDLLKSFNKVRERVEDPKISGDILFEGTQGIMLDPMYGTYPYVTSTPTIPSYLSYGSGIKAGYEVFGVFKAYVTRVGAGPFPTELNDDTGDAIRKSGGEFGSTTGRPRRCGWIDLPQLKYAIEISNTDHLVMTKADVLNGFDKIGVCVGYDRPFCVHDLEDVNAEIEYIKGWKNLESSEFGDFVSLIEKYIQKRIDYISFGPSEEEIKVR
ncbi:adenylosuccinate synthetase [Athalassotoga saccharophila]|uniref:adenylosuccinate synthetase n=1 Tax=Athalassotoga saccharophila TaxID=1441386 RepID=UPI00137AB4B9|nr:adenylosuccinate synthetase [Athalassotoga saccharophila]BBJ28520.1 adenylosuccinate synthetase [Athalassotoga saccharophila]